MIDIRDDPDDPGRRWLRILPVRMTTERRFAVFVVDELQRILPLERDNGNNNNSADSGPQEVILQQRQRRTTGLLLHGQNRFHDDAIAVFCYYLKQSTCALTALNLCQLPRQHYRLLLEALQHNTSVKELHVHWRRNDVGIVGMIELLQSRNDFEALCFYSSCFSVSQILPFLRRKDILQYLKKLRFDECCIDDRGLEWIVQAVVDGNHHHGLESLSLRHNEITARGLAYLCVALRPSIFPRLQQLLLGHNRNLLEEPDVTQRFVSHFLLAPDTMIKNLDVSFCCTWAVAYVYFIKALETNRTLLVLNIADDELPALQPIRSPFIDCLPKVKTLQHLIVTPKQHLFDENDKELKTAYRRNASLFQLSTKAGQPLTLNRLGETAFSLPLAPFLVSILKRNQQLAYIDHLLPPTATPGSANDITIPRGRWSRVLAQVGQGPEGVSPVYMILRAALAIWPESKSARTESSSSSSSTAITTTGMHCTHTSGVKNSVSS
jgi:Leucine Rich repeat